MSMLTWINSNNKYGIINKTNKIFKLKYLLTKDLIYKIIIKIFIIIKLNSISNIHLDI